jgi:hypothetical protein
MGRHDRRVAASARRRGQETDREPLRVSIPEAARLSGYCEGSIWGFIRKGILRAVRVPGIRSTGVWFADLKALLDPENSAAAGEWFHPNPRGKPRTRAGKRGAQPTPAANTEQA